MSNLSLFLYEWRFVIVLIIAVILYAIFSWTNFKSVAYAVMLQAKSLAKDTILNSGKEQEDYVVKKLYVLFPKLLSFVQEKHVRQVVHYLFIKGKDYMDDLKINGSIKDEE